MADYESSIPNTAESRFMIASLSSERGQKQYHIMCIVHVRCFLPAAISSRNMILQEAISYRDSSLMCCFEFSKIGSADVAGGMLEARYCAGQESIEPDKSAGAIGSKSSALLLAAVMFSPHIRIMTGWNVGAQIITVISSQLVVRNHLVHR